MSSYSVRLWYHVGMKKPNFSFEKKLWAKNIKYVIGIDEVGRGAFAGPIVAGAVVFPKTLRVGKNNKFLKQINDSKLLKPNIRRQLSKQIKKHSVLYAIEEVDIKVINKYGIGYANKMVFRKVVRSILSRISGSEFFLLSDGYRTKYIRKINVKNHEAIINGDQKSITIAAASIIAKVHRDSLMKNFSRKYHHYKFAKNKGYGTEAHQKALKKYGLSEIHRRSFELTKFLTQ